MKKIFLILCGLALSFSAYSQTDTSKTDDYSTSMKGKLQIHTSAKLGFGQLNSLTYKALNGNVGIGEVLVSYGFSKSAKLMTGIGFMEFNANVFDSGSFQSLKNEYIQIPLKVSFSESLGRKSQNGTRAMLAFGLFGSYHRKSTLEGQNATITDKNLTWAVGGLIDVGVEFHVHRDVNIGIGIESQFNNPKLGDNHKMRVMSNMLRFTFIFKR